MGVKEAQEPKMQMTELEECPNCNKLTPKWMMNPIQGNGPCDLKSPSCPLCWENWNKEFDKTPAGKKSKRIQGPISKHLVIMCQRFRTANPNV